MLLFMIETHLDYLKQLLRKLRLKKFFKMLIDIVTIFINFRNSRPAHKSAIRAYHPVAQAVIITVEEVGKIRMVLLVALQIWQEEQLHEEPRWMGAVRIRGGYILILLI